MHRLITIPMSHYNERARWALDVAGIDYREQGYLPLFHFLPVMLHTIGRGTGTADRASSRFSTPLFITSDGRHIHDSGEILAFAAQQRPDAISMSEDALVLAKRFHDELGPKARLLTYHWCLPDAELMVWIARQNVGPVQAEALRFGYPAIRRAMRRALGVTPDRAERALATVRHVFDDVSRLVRGREFLVGDRFSTADLTFASLASLALGVNHEEGYGAVMPRLDRCPSEARVIMHELRETEAGKFALRMYRDERGR